MVGIKRFSLDNYSYRLTTREKRLIVEKIEHELLCFDTVVITVHRQDRGESPRGGKGS